MADLGALLEKLGRNAGMAPSEIMQLRQKGRDLDAVGSVAGGWFKGGGMDPHFSYMSADQGAFGIMPNLLARIGTNTNQTISTGVQTALKPGDALFVNSITRSHGIGVDVANGGIDLRDLAPGELVYVHSRVYWSGHATGVRSVALYEAITNTFLWQLNEDNPPSAGNGPQQNGFFSISNTFDSPRVIQLRVTQSSGGDLDVDYWRLDALRVR